MGDKIIIEPMTEKFILWRCLHFGPLSHNTIDQLPSDSQIDWEPCRTRNIPLLTKLMRNYRACAILARHDDRIVGKLRFYPRLVWDMRDAGEMCLQQDYPNGPAENFAEMFKTFGQAISEVFNDPELKQKAKEFAESAADSAKTLGNRFKDEDVKDKFRDVGKAAEVFGKSIADCFKQDKNK